MIDTEDERLCFFDWQTIQGFYLSPRSVSIYLTKYWVHILSCQRCNLHRSQEAFSRLHCFQDCIFHSAEVHRDSTQAAGFLNENILTGKESCSAQLQYSDCQQKSTNTFWKNSWCTFCPCEYALRRVHVIKTVLSGFWLEDYLRTVPHLLPKNFCGTNRG